MSFVAVTSLVMAGCVERSGTPAQEPERSILEMESAEDALRQVEADLMAADGRTVEFEVVSEGAFSAALEGRLNLATGEELSLEATGTFGPDPATPWVRGTGGRMLWGNGDAAHEAELPPALREAVVIGLVRMGVLHNLARLLSGAPPDHADGTVRSWVETEEVRWVPATPDDGARGIAFGILVSGARTADATVWLDADGRLVGREQVVRFPGGEMRVVERYRLRE
jgi:hypothetical protein